MVGALILAVPIFLIHVNRRWILESLLPFAKHLMNKQLKITTTRVFVKSIRRLVDIITLNASRVCHTKQNEQQSFLLMCKDATHFVTRFHHFLGCENEKSPFFVKFFG